MTRKKFTFEQMKNFQNQLLEKAEKEAVKKYGKDKAPVISQSKSNFKTLLSWCLFNDIEPEDIFPYKKGGEIGWQILYHDKNGKHTTKEFFSKK